MKACCFRVKTGFIVFLLSWYVLTFLDYGDDLSLSLTVEETEPNERSVEDVYYTKVDSAPVISSKYKATPETILKQNYNKETRTNYPKEKCHIEYIDLVAEVCYNILMINKYINRKI